jgi:molybdopterin-guanine dinucleotide biosynthesis protein B
VIAVSGPSGAGKTRLLARLIPALARRGVACAVVKHTRHPHPFDRRGKDTEVLRRAGAIATAIEGPSGMAWFGPPAGGLEALVARMPAVPLVLAEGFRDAPVPRIEVHRRTVSREFLCARDPRVLAVVTDEPPPREVRAFAPDDVELLAELLCARFGLGANGPPERERGRTPRGWARLRQRPRVSRVPPESGRAVAARERGRMAKKMSRKGGSRRGRRSGTKRSGSAGGRATLRARGPEFYSEIGRKGGKRSAASRRRRAGRTTGGRSKTSGRGGRRSGSSRRSRSSR